MINKIRSTAKSKSGGKIEIKSCRPAGEHHSPFWRGGKEKLEVQTPIIGVRKNKKKKINKERKEEKKNTPYWQETFAVLIDTYTHEKTRVETLQTFSLERRRKIKVKLIVQNASGTQALNTPRVCGEKKREKKKNLAE